MISSKRLLHMAKRWMKAARISRKRISYNNNNSCGSSACTTTTAPETAKGHFVVYTNDGKRFMLPLKWLANGIFGELLEMAEEEFGLGGDGPITLPFEASFMEDVVKLMKSCGSKDLKEKFLLSITSRRHPVPISHVLVTNSQQQLLVC